MDKWLVGHAVKNAWQRPGADAQLIIKPNRITETTGAIGHIRDGRSTIPMPGENWWHVFHVGMLHVNYGNLNIPPELWTRGDLVINQLDVFMLVYNERGVGYPLHNCYFWRCVNGAILLACPQSTRYSWVESEDLYLRIYPGYNGGDVTTDAIPPTFSEYHTVSSVANRQIVFTRYQELRRSVKGYLASWVNGVLIEPLTIDDLTTWADVEFRVDGRVRRIVDFKCGDLDTFNSKLDNKRKYHLHIPKGDDKWTFDDDLEIHVIYKRMGRYYHLHRSEAIRQLTFNDISIPSERIAQIRGDFGPVTNIDDIIFRVLIRDDYMDRKAMFNTDRVHDMYLLPSDDLIRQAIVGANANVPEWQAANLEQSAVNRLAAAKRGNVTRALCTDAYGYNALTYYSADTPTKLTLDNGVWQCELPALLQRHSTVYEYDVNGKLLGYNEHRDLSQYRASNPKARVIEAIQGEASDAADVVDNAPDFTLVEGVNYSYYLRTVKSGVPTNEYHLAEEGTDYEIVDGHLMWDVDRTRRHPTVLSDLKHVLVSETFTVDDGEIHLSVQTRGSDGLLRPLWVPMETVEVWLNEYPLVHGVDFVVVWPEVFVVNKVFVNDGGENRVYLRARGATGTLRVPETGFVTSGLFSNNDRFDVRQDKVIRIVSAGKLLHRDDVKFREDTGIGAATVADGWPYSIADATVPLRTIAEGDTYALRDRARDLDLRIEDYLSAHIPLPPPATIIPLPHWYHLYSPVLNKIMWDVLNGYITLVEDDDTHRISTTQLDRIMLNYDDLLKFDPAYIGYDVRFVKIHPHILYTTVEVDELCFAVLDRVNSRYLNSAVLLNQYLKIKGR